MSEAPGIARVSDADPLLRLLAVTAARELGFAVAVEEDAPQQERPAVRFVALHGAALCARLSGRGSARAPVRAAAPARGGNESAGQALLVAYSAGPPAVLAAHALHGCADLVLELRAVGGRPCLVHPSPRGVVQRAGLSPREADVLLLVLAGCTTREVAARLCISAATARSHCRALLRKFGAADRRALRARLLGGAPPGAPHPPRVTPPTAPKFAEPRP
jgi:DNA-binding CsgD family transcriptional regulator